MRLGSGLGEEAEESGALSIPGLGENNDAASWFPAEAAPISSFWAWLPRRLFTCIWPPLYSYLCPPRSPPLGQNPAEGAGLSPDRRRALDSEPLRQAGRDTGAWLSLPAFCLWRPSLSRLLLWCHLALPWGSLG